MTTDTPISVVGLGYVGLPLAVALARHHRVIGFDIDSDRVAEIGRGEDRTDEIESAALLDSSLRATTTPEDMAGSEIFIVTVPTPVDADKRPNLGPVETACRTVAPHLRAGAIVVLESTVYPGVTENICGPILAAGSGLECGQDFFLGYSPERINPGDREHTIDRITKVVAGQTPEVAERLGRVYGAINGGLVFLARDIKTAEAAKVIENAQRDINIAFINEVTMIFHRLDVSVYDVLEAAGTKWNFLPFKPGLVGGHCIGVDPFYLAHRALELGHDPEVILAGRRINDGMGDFIAAELDRRIDVAARVLVLGLTFKENVPDLRNAKVIDLIDGLKTRGHRVDVHDPVADPADAAAQHGIELLPTLDGLTGYDCLVGAVSHNAFRALDVYAFAALLTSRGLLADVQGMWHHLELPNPMRRWQL